MEGQDSRYWRKTMATLTEKLWEGLEETEKVLYKEVGFYCESCLARPHSYSVANANQSVATALDSSDWRCPRETEESVPRCRGNQVASVCPMNPDFRIPGVEKSENGLRRTKEEDDGEAEDPKRPAAGGAEESEGRPGNPDVPRKAADPVQERSHEETRRNRHVPGGAWLSKVWSFFKGQRFETQKC
ncbi:hypothetical protein NDU88_001876 [Pleurodeles waltl]|uniref:Uncharacterized protein n=1 Tax=Pleurodeles waltl TaxID=8319 RepID=A0AAV7T1B1_PLEWA|nr:hypothetical protein NDU88_001876 [Pleurodeles waltl]